MCSNNLDKKQIADLLGISEESVTLIQDSGGYISSGVVATLLGVRGQTLRNWHNKGTLVPERVLVSGHRRYSLQQVIDFKRKSRKEV